MDNVTHVTRPEPLIFLKEFRAMQLFIYHVWLCILLFGMISNTINLTVFFKIGFRDNVTVTLLFLSISDLINLILNIPYIVMWFVQVNFPDHDWPFNSNVFEVAFYWYAQIFYDYSSFVSVFLGLVRCACVARPLLFKSMFTVTRTLIILGVLFVAAVSLRVPVLTIIQLTWAINPQTNSTWLSFRVTDNFREIYRANDIINRNIVAWVAYIIAVACVIVLVTKLQEASRFRQSLGSQQTTAHRRTHKLNTTPSCKDTTPQQDTTKTPNELSNQNEKSSNKMSAKDLQVIQSVTIICAIFILSQLPFQTLSTIRLFYPEIGISKTLKAPVIHIKNKFIIPLEKIYVS
ncbi:chemosensory receptor C [Elysia marginata]|uniref:Chemosensory receptor C n=1 Tax=Elysia marginata TaxID=1093978 RepID=A0AAV4HAC0_9GAST|nr:chemosensory receptor C [Elysia marginata]